MIGGKKSADKKLNLLIRNSSTTIFPKELLEDNLAKKSTILKRQASQIFLRVLI